MAAEAAQSRLAELAQRYGLGAWQAAELHELLLMLERDDRAPTTVRAPSDAVDAHVADSLSGLEVPALAAAGSIADVGAGAGLPGLVLAAALPEAEVSLLESQARKCDFIERAARAMGLRNATVVCTRAEEWGEGIGAHDAVTARALAPQPVVLEYAAPLMRIGGVLVDWRGQRDRREEDAAVEAASTLGMVRVGAVAVHPFPAARDRHLHLFEKERATPARFPRRAGMARKRPLA
jgi:16S rRNA (guanine527-N7)-methyltransferase